MFANTRSYSQSSCYVPYLCSYYTPVKGLTESQSCHRTPKTPQRRKAFNRPLPIQGSTRTHSSRPFASNHLYHITSFITSLYGCRPWFEQTINQERPSWRDRGSLFPNSVPLEPVLQTGLGNGTRIACLELLVVVISPVQYINSDQDQSSASLGFYMV